MNSITKDEQMMAKLASTGKTIDEIADELHLEKAVVINKLNSPMIQNLRNQYIEEANKDIELKRLKRANVIIDDILDAVEDLAKVNVARWKMQHVKLFELVLERRDKVAGSPVVNNIGTVNVANINQGKEDKTKDTLDNQLKKLPADQIIKFWNEVEDLARQYVFNHSKSLIDV